MPSANVAPKKYFLEKDRVESFKWWPFSDRQKCSIRKMAEAGFYYCGLSKDEDTVACFLCEKQLDGWEATDDPWSEHKKHAPQCDFAKLGIPEREITVAQQLDLMLVFVDKVFDRQLNEAEKKITEFGNKARKTIQDGV